MRRECKSGSWAAYVAVGALALACAGAARAADIGAQYRRADTDGDGMLSRAEVERGLPRLAKSFDAIDTNHDGRLSAEELRAWRRNARTQRKTKGPSKFDEYFARADADGDGALSRSEAAKGMPRIAGKFDRIDTNGDGKITRDELRAWLSARRGARAASGAVK